MTERTPPDPDVESVVDELLEFAEQIAGAAREHDAVTVSEIVHRLGERAEDASGEARRLFEIAEAFARTHSLLGDFGQLGVTATRFVRDFGDDACDLLRQADGASGLRLEDVPEPLRAPVHELIEHGVLRESGRRVRVRMSMRGVVAQLVDPPLVRMWAAVESARKRAEDLPEPKRVAFLARELGLEPDLVRRHLKRDP